MLNRIPGREFDSMAKPNWKNRTLFHGDNLEFLRAMDSHTVHLIATDPPFKKGKDFHATPDSLAAGASFQDRWSWERDVHDEWVDKISDDFPRVMNVIEGSRNSYGDNMGAYLCFMAVRLLEMHRVLREDGSIYLHCDHTASHYLKELLDAVFGWKGFRNEIVWCYRQGGRSSKEFARKHDILFWYSKSGEWTFDPTEIRMPYEGTGGYQTSGKGVTRKDTGKTYKPHPDGKIPEDWWDIPALPPMSKERTGAPTQKPLKLYQRIVRSSSKEGDIVLDPFCGCATTLIAAERLRRKWVGMDLWDGAHKHVIDRLKDEYLRSPKSESGEFFGLPGARKLQFDDATITYTKTPPERTDEGDEAVPFLLVRERVKEPEDEYATNLQRRTFLLDQYGSKCQGCDRVFDDPRYLELDHNRPRVDGGWNHISNRILLCGPCNKLKSHIYTLSGLRRENNKRGYMNKEGE